MRPPYPARSAKRQVIQWCLSQSGESLQTTIDGRVKVVFTEFVWDMGFCDPCAAPPLSQDELRQLGVFWLDAGRQGVAARCPSSRPVMLTRLHVRYSAATFPEDLTFQKTQDQENFQERYVLRHQCNPVASLPACDR